MNTGSKKLNFLRISPINEIKLTQVKIPLKKPFAIAGGAATQYFQPILIEIQDAEGNSGHSTLDNFAYSTYDGHGTQVSKLVLAEDYIPHLFHLQESKSYSNLYDLIDDLHCIRGKNNFALSALEMALWDLIGKRDGIPCFNLFQQAFSFELDRDLNEEEITEMNSRSSKGIPSKISIGFKDSYEEYSKEIDQGIKRGITAFKLKINTEPKNSIELLKYLRKNYPEIILDTDANASFRPSSSGSINDIIDFYKNLDEYNVRMHEQPSIFHGPHLDILKTLQTALKTPLCPDESIHSLWEAQQTAKIAEQTNKQMYLNTKIHRTGGIREVIRILAYLHEFNKAHPNTQVIPWAGYMPDQEGSSYAAIGLYSLPVKTIHCDPTDHNYWFDDSIYKTSLHTQNGNVKITTNIGLGVELDENKIDKLKIWEQTFSHS
jgi:o-succinylbenzoate synthase